MPITSIDQLRTLYAAPKGRSVQKQLVQLDAHCTHFIAMSPFLLLSSASAAGAMHS